MRKVIIIPARYASTRFPGKPLALLGGVPIIVRVAGRVAGCADFVAVATDDSRIAEVCRENCIEVVMTRSDHPSGTDRICEAYDKIAAGHGEFDVIINVQGDEPFIDPAQIELLVSLFNDPSADIATLCTPYPADDGFEGLRDPNLVKLVVSESGEALYFSRSVIPYLRNKEQSEWPGLHKYLTHIGIYGYRPEVLRRVTEMPKSSLEEAESLEQLRWLSAGLRIKVGETPGRNVGIDTPEDLEHAERVLVEMQDDR